MTAPSLTFKTLLLTHMVQDSPFGEIAKQLTYDPILGRIDGPALRDELIRQHSDLKEPLWELWKFLPTWRTCVERLPAETDARPWREVFHSVNQLAEGDLTVLIEGFLLEGINAIGSLAGVAKTWFGLSMSAALTIDGRKFLGKYNVAEKRNVLYLCPELPEKTFRKRAEKFGLLNEPRFFCQTIKDGAISLNSQTLLAAVAELKPVIFLDTQVRFSPVESENSAADNREFANLLTNLMRAGAIAIVLLHHSNKASAEALEMTLENVLRGTGDLGAMCAVVWGLRHARVRADKSGAYLKESKQLSRIEVDCVKPTDLPNPATPFLAQLRPYIDRNGEIGILDEDINVTEVTAEEVNEEKITRLRSFFKKNPEATQTEAAHATGISQATISRWQHEEYQLPLKLKKRRAPRSGRK